MHDTLRRNQRVGHLLYRGGLAFEDQNFETVIVIQMHVKSGQHQMKMIVLHGREAVRQETHVMIVDQRQGADDNTIGLLGGFLDEGVADQVAKRFGTVGVASLTDVLIEFVEQVGIDGYADAA